MTRHHASLAILTIVYAAWLLVFGVWPLLSPDLIDYCEQFSCSRYLVEPSDELQMELDCSNSLEEAMSIVDHLLQFTKLQTTQLAWHVLMAGSCLLTLLWTSYREKRQIAWWVVGGLTVVLAYHQWWYALQLTRQLSWGYGTGAFGVVAVIGWLLGYPQWPVVQQGKKAVRPK